MYSHNTMAKTFYVKNVFPVKRNYIYFTLGMYSVHLTNA